MSYPKTGVCTDCKEWTQVPNSCCGAPVSVEGHLYSDSDILDSIDVKQVSGAIDDTGDARFVAYEHIDEDIAELLHESFGYAGKRPFNLKRGLDSLNRKITTWACLPGGVTES